MFLKNRNIISKIKRSKVTDYAASINKTIVDLYLGRHEVLLNSKLVNHIDGQYEVYFL